MTKTLSTNELRAWARESGFAVADRGRIPAQVHAAWEEASQRAKPKTSRGRAATKPARAAAAAPQMPKRGAVDQRSQAKDIRLLQSQLAELTDRVKRLERELPAEKVAGRARKKAAR